MLRKEKAQCFLDYYEVAEHEMGIGIGASRGFNDQLFSYSMSLSSQAHLLEVPSTYSQQTDQQPLSSQFQLLESRLQCVCGFAELLSPSKGPTGR